MSVCTRCGASFTCAMADASDESTRQEPCWCTQLPPLPPRAYVRDEGGEGHNLCLCPTCLRAHIAAQTDAERT